jgi:outer membrane receptor for ferric coprogen and ferric-rhodotorulic acid
LAIPDPLTTTPENTKDQHRYINADGINSNGFELELAGELYANLQVRVN